MGSRRMQLLAALGVGALLAAVLVAVSLLRTGDDVETGAAPAETSTAGDPGAAPPPGLSETLELLDGIPQQGTVLGREDAPVTLVEFADLQCSHCATFGRTGFPDLVRDYVRAGDLRIELRGLAFLGPDSERALRVALAAGEQDRLWHVVHLFFHAQGAANSGWVTDSLVDRIGEAVPGLDRERMLAETTSAPVADRMAEDVRAAQQAEVPGTPFFELGPTGGELRPLQVSSHSADAFRPAIDELLGR